MVNPKLLILTLCFGLSIVGVPAQDTAPPPEVVVPADDAPASLPDDPLAIRAQELDEKERELLLILRQRSQLLEDREAGIVGRETEVGAREKLATQREATLTARETTLAAREELLVARERLIGAQEVAATQFQPKWPAPSIVGRRAVVIDAHSGQVLHRKDADERVAVASTQKLMTALLVAEAGDLDGEITVQPEDTRVEPTIIGIKAGETYTRRQLMEALLVRSGNDLALCLARDNAGSVEAFAAKMNARALQLGMANSNFINPHGLTEEGQYSTAHDMALLARAAYQIPVIKQTICRETMTFHFPDGRESTLTNTNRVLRSYEPCTGMKTGYTRASGNCLVCSGEKGGRARIIVVLGSNGSWIWKDSQVLLEWALNS